MGALLVEGFELISDAATFTTSTGYDNLRNWLNLAPADETTDWFADTDDEVSIDSTESRVSGQSLKLSRGGNAATNWSYDYSFNMGWSFPAKQKMSMGFGFLFSTPPTEGTPLAMFRYDTGGGEEEQASLWVSPTGALYLSSTTVVMDYSLISTPVPIAESFTAAAVINFSNWNYIEWSLDYSVDTPTLSIRVNGVTVVNGATSASFKKATSNNITAAYLINPSNAFFGGSVAIDHNIDDIYIANADLFGPQQVVGLLLDGAAVSNDWATGTPNSGAYNGGTTGAEADDYGQEFVYEIDDLGVGFDEVNGVSVTMIASNSDADASIVEFGLEDSSGNEDYRVASLPSGGAAAAYRYTWNELPGSLTFDETGVNALRVMARSGEAI